MVDEKRKTTVPIPSVGADGEQPILNNSTGIITGYEGEINSPGEISQENFLELQRLYDRLNNPAYLHTVTLSELYETSYPSRPPIIDGLLYPGTYLLVGAPKVGKSFLVAQLAYHISTGQPLWDYPVRKSTVLYLALEDDYKRLQDRMFRMFGVDCTEELHFATCAKQIGSGLEDQLELFLKEHPDTRLVIVDTLQKVREISGESYSYASDYEIVGKLKQFADKYGICLLLVHHTRKQPANDKFEMISGTTGLLGCADGAFLLQKERGTSLNATLDIVGRDQGEQKLYLVRNRERLVWELDHAEAEGKCKAFLYRIAANTCVDMYRKTGAVEFSIEDIPTELPSEESGFERIHADLNFRQQIRSLPPEQQEVLLLRFGQELTLGQIAQVTGVPLRTVQSRLRAALKKLKSQLEKEEHCDK